MSNNNNDNNKIRKITIQNRTKDTIFNTIMEKGRDKDGNPCAFVYIFDAIRGKDYYDNAEFDKNVVHTDDLGWGDLLEINLIPDNDNNEVYYMISQSQIKETTKKLKDLQNEGDTEQTHIDADTLLLNLLPEEIQIEFHKIDKWYA